MQTDRIPYICWPQSIFRSVTEGGLNRPPFLFWIHWSSRLATIVAPALEAMGYELVRVAVLGRDRPTVQVMADKADGSQISVADCEAISHALSAMLDVEDPIPGAWSLEISSAGIDRPLTRPKDWNRFAGHLARAETIAPIEGRKRFSGVVLGADDTARAHAARER